MNPTWKPFRPARGNELAYSTLTLPAIYVATSAWVGYSVCLRKTDIENVDNFNLQPLAEAISDEYVLCISYPVSDTQSVRYKLWDNVGEVVSAPLYEGQTIGPGAYLELWTTINSPNPLEITEDIVIETGLTYSRLGGNGIISMQVNITSGPPGPPGAAATIAVGTTTTLAPGEDATVNNSGTSSAAIFNFGIPEGEPGQDGDPGVAATITVGTVDTVPYGDPATVTNSGTSSAAVFNFEIPQGAPGAPATANIFAGSAAPNGSQSATGPAIYLQTTSSPPIMWFKVTAGTSNNEWN